MDRPLRIALVGTFGRGFEEAVAALARRPHVLLASDLLTAARDLAAEPADLVLLLAPATAGLEEFAGALRLWRSLLPATAVLLAGPAAREVELQAFADRLAIGFLSLPPSPRALAAAVDRALAATDRPRPEVYLDLVHGIADEVNNPLQFLMGYLQLVQLTLDPDTGRDLLDQVQSAVQGAQQVQRVVERLRAVETAANGPRRHEVVDLHGTIARALGENACIAVVREPEPGPFAVIGDPDLLEPAFADLAAAAMALRAADVDLHVVLTRLDGRVRLRFSMRGEPVADWNLPRSFEPYALSRVLRGSAHGLALFHAQTVAHAHGGSASARRLPDGAVALDFELPS